jgi:DNA invertase Pin-like site-specific DNA recombinase
MSAEDDVTGLLAGASKTMAGARSCWFVTSTADGGVDARPMGGCKANCKDASRRQFDLIAAWSVDRLGRSLQDLVGFLTEIHALGVNLFLHQQGIDTTTPAGKALFQMMGVFAEFERAMIQDRVRAGLERAKAQGKVLGRPSTDAGKVEAIKADLKAGGVGIIKLAKLHGVGTGTVQRIKDSLAAA